MSASKNPDATDVFDDEDSLFDDELAEATDDGILRLSDLVVSDRIPFALDEQTTIYFVDTTDFSPSQEARFGKAMKLISKTMELLEKKPGDKSIEVRLEKYMDGFVKMILPDMPDEILATLKYGQKGNLLTYWARESGYMDNPDQKKSRNGRRRAS